VIDGCFAPDERLAPGVRALVTTRRFLGVSLPPFHAGNLGDRCGDDADAVAANRARLAQHLPAPPRWLRQVHGVEVHRAEAQLPTASESPSADAAYTRERGVVLAVLTADCLPLLLSAESGAEVAAIHAGWRGLSAGVIEATLRHFESPPGHIKVWLGPAIGPASYEVGDEVRAAFCAVDADAEVAFAATRPGHWLCDLYALARQRLAAAGVTRVSGGGYDTHADARFYSHRRDRTTGRFASLIWRTA
jgi:YfiH family protein